MPLQRKQHWPSLTHQHISLEFSILKNNYPEGIYLCPILGNPIAWTGVIFPRKGPYAQAVLHFQLNFPSDYPRSPPLLTFQSEIFHPLVTPLTTYTYPTGPRNSDSTSINDGDQLPPGGLSLRHGFPKWFQRSENSGRSQVFDSKGEQRQYNESLRIGSFAADGKGSTSPVASDNGIERVSEPFQLKSPPTWMSCDSDILGVLQYLKSVLEDEDLLDRLDLQASANTGAWRAWQAHRGISREANVPPDNQTNGIPPSQASVVSVGKGVVSSQRPPTAWNWDGVWANRVRKAVDVSTSDSVLYSNGNSNEVIHFLDVDEDTFKVIRKNILKGNNN